jgi:hypothetical protein
MLIFRPPCRALHHPVFEECGDKYIKLACCVRHDQSYRPLLLWLTELPSASSMSRNRFSLPYNTFLLLKYFSSACQRWVHHGNLRLAHNVQTFSLGNGSVTHWVRPSRFSFHLLVYFYAGCLQKPITFNYAVIVSYGLTTWSTKSGAQRSKIFASSAFEVPSID